MLGNRKASWYWLIWRGDIALDVFFYVTFYDPPRRIALPQRLAILLIIIYTHTASRGTVKTISHNSLIHYALAHPNRSSIAILLPFLLHPFFQSLRFLQALLLRKIAHVYPNRCELPYPP